MTEHESYDPFEEFDRHHGAGRVRDPYPGFAALRRAGAVSRASLRELLDLPGPVPGMPDEVWVVATYDAVNQVLRDGSTFSSAGYAQTMGLVMGHTLLGMDAPEHTRYRALFQKAFTRGALDRWEKELIRPVIEQHIARFAARGHADLVRELTFPFPVNVIAGMIGLDATDHDDFHRWAVELISISMDPERGLRASQQLRGLYARLLAARRKEPRDDLVSALAHAELDGVRLTDEQIFSFLLLLAPAGAETTYRSTSNLLCGLLTHPEQLAALRAKPLLVPQAIEEALRCEPPITSILRSVTRDVMIDGVVVPAGAWVSVNLASANHDETRWERPEAFDIFREPRANLAFATGPHRCLGMHLARMEMRIALELLFERLPDLRLDPAAEDVHITGMIFRSPRTLPVVFTPA